VGNAVGRWGNIYKAVTLYKLKYKLQHFTSNSK
jgi:hypothetical protein